MTKVSSSARSNPDIIAGTGSSNSSATNSHGKRGRQEQEEQDEAEFVTRENPVYGSLAFVNSQTESSSMPGEKKKKPHSSGVSGHGGDGHGDRVENYEMNDMKEAKDGGKKTKGKSRSRYENNGEIFINDLSNGSANDDSNRLSIYSYSNGNCNNGPYNSASDFTTPSHDNSFDYDRNDPGPHREMAIDVPENFVASVKSPPRYPPPVHSAKETLRKSMSSPLKSNDKGTPSHSENSLNSRGVSPSRQHPIKPTPEEMERLVYHQEELKKRREEASKLQADQDFLRASLRGSKKLQALENRKFHQAPPLHPGFVNTAFDGDDLYDEDNETDDSIGEAEESAGKKARRQSSLCVSGDRYLKKNIVLEDVMSSHQHMQTTLTSPDDQQYLSFLHTFFCNHQFQQAVHQHNKIVEISSRSPPVRPVQENACEITSELCSQAQHMPHDPFAQKLLDMLNEPKVKNLLETHDAVAQQSLEPPSPGLDMQNDQLDFPLVQYGEDSVKILHLEKTNEHLGATVKNEGESVIIARIVKGGAAEKSGLLHEGDEILEVNGIDMRGRNIGEVSDMLAGMNGTITFMIIPSHLAAAEVPPSNSVMHLRALFSYDPEDDHYIPCKELGISFLRGDILHAIALDDPNWWQAFREGEEETLAGLIPSKSFTEQREAMKADMENKENKRKNKVCACGKKERKKKKKKYLYNGATEDAEETPTYEEIAKYYPEPNRKRPIVLIGPSNVGRQELQQRLLDSDPDRFGAPVPHTTRSPQHDELEGSTYYFISREDFQSLIGQTQFLEYGELSKVLYGTSVDAVRTVINQGKVCLLKLQSQSLKVIRSSDLKPYIVFVCPPNLEKLRQLQDQLDKANAPAEHDGRGQTFLTTDDQLKEIIDCAREIEDVYGHLFDYILVNGDLDHAYTELLDEINRIEMEPQWVPAVWIDNL